MEIKVNQISETDFRELDCYTLFEDKLLDRTFGVISEGAFSFKFGWQSDTINPFTLRVKEGIYLIGIDLNLLIFDFHNKKAILKATLIGRV